MKNFFISLIKPRPWVSKLLLLAFVGAFLGLGFMDYLEPIRLILDQDEFAFHLGEMRFSAFLILKALLTLIMVFWAASIIADFAESRITKLRGVKSSNRSLIIKTVQILVYFAAITIGLDTLGFDLTTLTIFGGALGIGLGFGLQKIASNFISGIILLFEKSIEDDDLVEMDDGTFGFVRHTGARYTLIETPDGCEVMIPNEDFITNRVTNWTYTSNQGRIEIMIGVSYKSDVEKARELILEAARQHPRCITEPAPVCFMREFADSSINLLLQFWVADVTLGRYEPQSDVMRTIWRLFKENGVEIPFPQRDVHITGSQDNAEASS